MADASFGPPWPNCDRTRITVLVRKDGLRLPVHKELVGLVAILMDLTELAGYDIVPGWTWGYACRAIAGTTIPSNHSQGTAVDINAPVNPRRKRGLPMVTNIPSPVVKLWTDHGFRWGGIYSWPDPMHFEFMGTIDDARRIERQLRLFLAGSGAKPVPPVLHNSRPLRPAPRRFPGTVQMGDHGSAVLVWQQVLRERGYDIATDGVFGQRTNHVVLDWQQKHLRPSQVDGIAGPVTWQSLLDA